jgi:hypothetical protein
MSSPFRFKSAALTKKTSPSASYTRTPRSAFSLRPSVFPSSVFLCALGVLCVSPSSSFSAVVLRHRSPPSFSAVFLRRLSPPSFSAVFLCRLSLRALGALCASALSFSVFSQGPRRNQRPRSIAKPAIPRERSDEGPLSRSLLLRSPLVTALFLLTPPADVCYMYTCYQISIRIAARPSRRRSSAAPHFSHNPLIFNQFRIARAYISRNSFILIKIRIGYRGCI